ncbi:MAG: hypothetical protein IPI92_11930 [Gemmatimonadetes bacterium]|nr:hypothetical protein [Gemmatimonadota bacterium]MBK7785710.1 hypothetical protein [Gemmatimonadota bacterium]
MIELTNDALQFRFPAVHPGARLHIDFQRTLRIPDDGRDYPLPPGLGRFPLRHVDDVAGHVPAVWLEHGGVMLPMSQAEALWLSFSGPPLEDRGTAWPCAIRIATGKIDAVTGKPWVSGLDRGPQNYLVHPGQPWLDGYCVERGVIRQFVAMPLGEGYTAEEQLTGRGEHGGIQVQVFPMKRAAFERRFPPRPPRPAKVKSAMLSRSLGAAACAAPMEMGLAAGGRMRQEIYADRFELSDWDLEQGSRVFVHLTNSVVWQAITGQAPPGRPPTAADYGRAGLPWFEYYDEARQAVPGSELLRRLRSVLELGAARGSAPLPENDAAPPGRVVRLPDRRVREWR